MSRRWTLRKAAVVALSCFSLGMTALPAHAASADYYWGSSSCPRGTCEISYTHEYISTVSCSPTTCDVWHFCEARMSSALPYNGSLSCTGARTVTCSGLAGNCSLSTGGWVTIPKGYCQYLVYDADIRNIVGDGTYVFATPLWCV